PLHLKIASFRIGCSRSKRVARVTFRRRASLSIEPTPGRSLMGFERRTLFPAAHHMLVGLVALSATSCSDDEMGAGAAAPDHDSAKEMVDAGASCPVTPVDSG